MRASAVIPVALIALAGCAGTSGPGATPGCDPDVLLVQRMSESGAERIVDARGLSRVQLLQRSEPAVAVRFCPLAASALRRVGTEEEGVEVQVDGIPALLEGGSLVDARGEAEFTQADIQTARSLARRLRACTTSCPDVRR